MMERPMSVAFRLLVRPKTDRSLSQETNYRINSAGRQGIYEQDTLS